MTRERNEQRAREWLHKTQEGEVFRCTKGEWDACLACDQVAALTTLLDTVQAEALDEALALFNAPTSENNGGPGDLLEEIKALQHNAKVWAQEAAEAEKRGAEREREACARLVSGVDADWPMGSESAQVVSEQWARAIRARGSEQ